MRHGNDEKQAIYKQDNSLNSSSQCHEEILDKARQLIKLYGKPKTIYCSPFRRARETVHIMKKLLPDVDIIIDANLSRFFSKKEKLNPSVRKKTLKYDPPITENAKEFKERVYKIEKIISKNKDITWCITHYLVIKKITKKYEITIPHKMPFLYHVIV